MAAKFDFKKHYQHQFNNIKLLFISWLQIHSYIRPRNGNLYQSGQFCNLLECHNLVFYYETLLVVKAFYFPLNAIADASVSMTFLSATAEGERVKRKKIISANAFLNESE